MAPDPDERYLLDKKNTKRIQSIVGTLLYYARSVDPTMLQEINEISQVQSKPTRDTEENATMLLDYTATFPNAVICYKARSIWIQTRHISPCQRQEVVMLDILSD